MPPKTGHGPRQGGGDWGAGGHAGAMTKGGNEHRTKTVTEKTVTKYVHKQCNKHIFPLHEFRNAYPYEIVAPSLIAFFWLLLPVVPPPPRPQPPPCTQPPPCRSLPP